MSINIDLSLKLLIHCNHKPGQLTQQRATRFDVQFVGMITMTILLCHPYHPIGRFRCGVGLQKPAKDHQSFGFGIHWRSNCYVDLYWRSYLTSFVSKVCDLCKCWRNICIAAYACCATRSVFSIFGLHWSKFDTAKVSFVSHNTGHRLARI